MASFATTRFISRNDCFSCSAKNGLGVGVWGLKRRSETPARSICTSPEMETELKPTRFINGLDFREGREKSRTSACEDCLWL